MAAARTVGAEGEEAGVVVAEVTASELLAGVAVNVLTCRCPISVMERCSAVGLGAPRIEVVVRRFDVRFG